MSAVLQLRILTGLHAGAHLLLEQDHYLLGAADDCDIVLGDDGVRPRHARLQRGDDGSWHLQWLPTGGEEASEPQALSPGLAVALGPLALCIDDPDAPWPTLEQLVFVPQTAAGGGGTAQHAPTAAPPSSPTSQPSPSPSDSGPGAPSATISPPTRPAQMKHRVVRAGVALVTTLATAVVVSLCLGAWPERSATQARSGTAVARPALPPEPETVVRRRAIESALKPLNLHERVQLHAAGSTLQVRAAWLNDGEIAEMAQALSKLSPRPTLQVMSDSDLLERMTEQLAEAQPEWRDRITVRHVGGGRVRVEGRVADAQEQEQLLAVLKPAFPQVTAWEPALASAKSQADGLMQVLREQGWNLEGGWDGQALQVEVRLAQADEPRWEQALVQARRQHPAPLRARLSWVVQPVPSLPFEIRSVVGGAMPYVLLADGERIGPGGTHRGWSLSAVTPDQVVFENGAQRAQMPR